MKKIFISGANGFLGQSLVKAFIKNDFSVVAGVRQPQDFSSNNQPITYTKFEIGNSEKENSQILNCDIVIHCAWQMSGKKSEQVISNLKAVKDLVELCRTHKKHLVFISSMAAHPQAQSIYGKTKREAEEIVATYENSTIVRPGTIVGDGGLFQRTQNLMQKLPILPLFYGGKQLLQLIGINELSEVIVQIASHSLTGVYNIASNDGIELEQMYKLMAKSQNLKRVFIHLPGDLFLVMVFFMEWLGLQLPITSDNLLGLKHHKVHDSIGDWRRIWSQSPSRPDLATSLSVLETQALRDKRS